MDKRPARACHNKEQNLATWGVLISETATGRRGAPSDRVLPFANFSFLKNNFLINFFYPLTLTYNFEL
jgi:hypothetical protein